VDKARIRIPDEEKRGTSITWSEIVCLFNPKEYTSVKQNTWTPEIIKGGNLPRLEFGGGSAETLTMQLFLDTSTTGEDVRVTIKKFLELMKVNDSLNDGKSNKGRPPRVIFSWGSNWSFNAVITRLSQKYTLFRDDGIPVRATLDVDFLQAEESQLAPQNPTTPGMAGYKRYTVSDGDTIDWIAFQEYGDATQWRHIAETNNLDDPRRLKSGQVLTLAPLP